jgi:hypothetical protein
MEAGFPERPVIGLLLRLVYQHHAQSVDLRCAKQGSTTSALNAGLTFATTVHGLCS